MSKEPFAEGRPGLVAGRKPVLELLANNPQTVESVTLQRGLRHSALSRIADACRKHHVRFRQADKRDLDRLFPGNHQGAVAETFEAGFHDLADVMQTARQSTLPLILALDQVQDTGNVGTLARTLYALGGAGLVIPRHYAAKLGGGAVRASAGALTQLPVARVVNLAHALDELEEEGFTIYCAQLENNSESIFEFTPEFPAVLVLGGEEKGVRPGVAKRCRTGVHVPMTRKFDSLNVAQAGGILAAFFARAARTQRR